MTGRGDLPEALARVAERCGETAALRVAYFYGGQDIYIPDPRRLVAGHGLVETLGRDLALALARIFGRGRLTIPFGPSRASSNRLGAIPAELRHVSRAEAARALGVHVRTIERARARERQGRGSNPTLAGRG